MMNLKKMSKTFIYCLECPLTNKARYIGKSNNPKQRLSIHLKESNKKRTHKECWIFSLKEKDLKPNLIILDEVDSVNWEFWEIFYINLFKSWNFNLVNSTNGGEGMSSEYMKKNNPMFNPEYSNKIKGIGNGNFGKKFSKEHRKKLSLAKKGKEPWNKGMINQYTEENKIKFLYKKVKCHQNNKIYISNIHAAKDLDLKKEAIAAVARGSRKHHKKYTFEYVD